MVTLADLERIEKEEEMRQEPAQQPEDKTWMMEKFDRAENPPSAMDRDWETIISSEVGGLCFS